jgi:hypothetical protein
LWVVERDGDQAGGVPRAARCARRLLDLPSLLEYPSGDLSLSQVPPHM